MAASLPLPGPLTKTSTCRIPWSMALRAACCAAIWAAYGVLLRDPLKPEVPPLLQATALPWGSVRVMSVLLKVDWIKAFPLGIDFLSRFLALVFAFFSATDSILSYFLAMDRLLPATVRRAPLLVRALVRVRWPCTGRPRRCLMPR